MNMQCPNNIGMKTCPGNSSQLLHYTKNSVSQQKKSERRAERVMRETEVELRGVEPLTFSLRTRRSTN